ncbi:MAG: hypothetical protein IPN86_14330 [Saprospiraceae bacterium]|nr:hypothetical protein [Saprospiraceae bacterium]
MSLAKKSNVFLTKDEIAYYVLNAKQVLQGEISTGEVLTEILKDRKAILQKLEVTSF